MEKEEAYRMLMAGIGSTNKEIRESLFYKAFGIQPKKIKERVEKIVKVTNEIQKIKGLVNNGRLSIEKKDLKNLLRRLG